MSDPLEVSTKALRESFDGSSAVSSFTRTRVLAMVRQNQQRRRSRWAFGIPVAAVLMGSAAFAAKGEDIRALANRAAVFIGMAPSSTGRPAVAPKPHPRPQSSHPVEEVPPISPRSTSAEPEPVAAEPEPVEVPHSVARQQATAPIPPPSDDPATVREMELYGAAHHAHFVLHDATTALAAWNAYLAQVQDGRFTTEARYNRAMCLLRLGRTDEARAALSAFAQTPGGYRQQEAQQLVEKLR